MQCFKSIYRTLYKSQSFNGKFAELAKINFKMTMVTFLKTCSTNSKNLLFTHSNPALSVIEAEVVAKSPALKSLTLTEQDNSQIEKEFLKIHI